MEGNKINATIMTSGFKPNEIRPRKMWARLQEDFLNVYNDYCEISNQRIPELNKEWNELHPDCSEEETDKELTPEERELKDLKDKVQMMEYGCFMRDNLDVCAWEASNKHPDSYVDGAVFMDGNLPIFVGRIKQHPEMYMTFILEK